MNDLDAHETVMRMALGHVTARAVHALAHFRIADHLAAGPLSAAELARLTRTHEPSLLRLLRASTALGLMAEEHDLRFALAPLGEALRSDAPRHAASATLAMGGPGVWRALGDFTRSVETGEPQLERTGGAKPFSDAVVAGASQTAEAMIAFYGDEPAAIAGACDFSSIGVLADIGGSSGNLMSTILERNPGTRGILYDLPYTVAAARQMLDARGVAGRCQVISGSFFDSVPAGAGAYLLSHVLHDWPDDKCDTILRNVRRAIASGGRLLVIEPVVTSGSDSNQAKILDIIALNMTGGRHRTVDEHRMLLSRTGFRITRVIDTSAAVSIIESEPV